MISLEKWQKQKRFVGFTDHDVALLHSLNFVVKTYVVSIVDELYYHWFQFEDIRAFFKSDEQIEEVKKLQCSYLLDLTEGEYGEIFINSRLNVARIHKRIGLPIDYQDVFAN